MPKTKKGKVVWLTVASAAAVAVVQLADAGILGPRVRVLAQLVLEAGLLPANR